MNIEIAEYRIHIGLHYCKHFKVKGLSHFTDFEILTFLSMLLLNCGDIEKNPGPLSEYSTPSVSSTSSVNDSSIKDKFSLVHYNVQSLTEKKDIIFSELSDFSVISITQQAPDVCLTSDIGYILVATSYNQFPTSIRRHFLTSFGRLDWTLF